MEVQDDEFDALVESWDAILQAEALSAVASDASATTFRAWKATKDHIFPGNLPIPVGHEALKSKWQSLFNRDSDDKFRRFLVANAIETNHIENVFLLTATT
ncbi:hypothetical protein C8R46DRAFT_181177 [Mycena filopes]|nr:hypothetical protein C8R46DRAFT_181177 [Mycena filopes]